MKTWIEAYAAHVRKRFGGRVLLRARVDRADWVDVCQLYALEDGGLVLKAWCGHDEECTDHEHAHDADDGHGEARHGGEHEHDHGHEGGAAHHCEYELWVSSPERIVFEARPAEHGKLCTGFGYLGISRTPQVLVPRGTEAPPEPGHEHGEF